MSTFPGHDHSDASNEDATQFSTVVARLPEAFSCLKANCPTDYEAARKADKAYREWMLQRGFTEYHLSLSHDYNVTVAHAGLIAVTGRTREEKEMLAGATIRSHLLDDLLDRNLINFERMWQDPRQFQDDFAKWGIDYIAQTGTDDGLWNLCKYSAAGAYITQAGADVQWQRCGEFKDFLVGPEPGALQRDVAAVHPVVLSALAHVGMDCFFAVERDQDARDQRNLSLLYDCLYAPLVYCHDRFAEHINENNRLLIGPEHLENEMLRDEALAVFIEIYLRHYLSVPDPRRARRFQQVLLVLLVHQALLKALKPCLQDGYAEVQRRLQVALAEAETMPAR